VKKPKPAESSFFVDESGDPIFYDHKGRLIVGKEGCSTVLILGFIETQDPQTLRRAVLDRQAKVLADPYYRGVPSLEKTAIGFHAKDDLPEIRREFFELIRSLDFKAQFVVCRKREDTFRARYKGKTSKFYDDLVTKLFQNVLHRFERNWVCVATRGSSVRQKPIEHALWRAKGRFEKKHNADLSGANFQVEMQNFKGEPCLSIIDYMNWAVYRAYSKGEMRFYEFVKDRVSLLRDVSMPDRASLCFCRKNPFSIEKAALLGLGSLSERTA
jgi:hypothetical protein